MVLPGWSLKMEAGRRRVEERERCLVFGVVRVDEKEFE